MDSKELIFGAGGRPDDWTIQVWAERESGNLGSRMMQAIRDRLVEEGLSEPEANGLAMVAGWAAVNAVAESLAGEPAVRIDVANRASTVSEIFLAQRMTQAAANAALRGEKA